MDIIKAFCEGGIVFAIVCVLILAAGMALDCKKDRRKQCPH